MSSGAHRARRGAGSRVASGQAARAHRRAGDPRRRHARVARVSGSHPPAGGIAGDDANRNAARSAIFAARLAQLDQDDAAFDAAVTKAEALLAPNDWLQRRELASVLLSSARDFSPMSNRTSEESERDLKRAHEVVRRGHRRTTMRMSRRCGDSARPRPGFDKNLELAEQALIAAYQRAPASAEIAMSLASLKSQQDKPDEMIPYLKDTIRYATTCRCGVGRRDARAHGALHRGTRPQRGRGKEAARGIREDDCRVREEVRQAEEESG